MDQIKHFLTTQNFRYEEDKFGIHFKYQGGAYIILNNEGDKNYLELTMPQIYDFSHTPEDRLKVFEAINQLQCEGKLIKGNVMKDNTVWLSVEMIMDEDPLLENYFLRLLDTLQKRRQHFYYLITE